MKVEIFVVFYFKEGCVVLEHEVSLTFLLFNFFGTKNAELFLMFIKNCRAMKIAIIVL